MLFGRVARLVCGLSVLLFFLSSFPTLSVSIVLPSDVAVRGLIHRVLGPHMVDSFSLETLNNGSANGEFEITWDAARGRPLIRGTDAPAMSVGLHWYIKYWCNCSITWGRGGSGDQLKGCTNSDTPLPRVLTPVRVSSPVRYRYYMNVCTLGYSAVFWHWDRWEREIDWMMLHGINLPLSFTGQEFVWMELYKEFGLTQEEVEAHFPGPAFLPWGRMGNIRGWGGPLSGTWQKAQFELHRRIMQRQEELGMTPVLPGFAGHIPDAITKKFPNANVTRSANWGHFNSTYSADFLLQPTDPLFEKIGKRFIELQREIFGITTHIYNADTFNEMPPSSNLSSYLADAGFGTYNGIVQGDPQGIWLLQGWLFENDKTFWKNDNIKAYLSRVPDDRAIVLDLFSDVDPIWDTTEFYFGKPFVWCMLHNFGGKRGVYGNLTDIALTPVLARTAKGSTMIGTGMTPEAIEQNPVMYELMSEMGWRSNGLSSDAHDKHIINNVPGTVADWVQRYIEQRYGGASQAATVAWQALQASAYNDKHMEVSIVQLRPWFTLSREYYNADVQARYNADSILAACRALFRSAREIPDVEHNGPWKYDAVDITRQVIANLFVDVLSLFSDSYSAYVHAGTNMTEPLIQLGSFMERMILDIDMLLSTDSNFLLGPWIEEARSWGTSNADKALLEFNARNQITLWGPEGNIDDYAAKAWAGLYKDYYAQRWRKFVQITVSAVQKGRQIDQKAYNTEQVQLGLEFCEAQKAYPVNPSGSVVSAMGDLLNKYGRPTGIYGTYVAHANSTITSSTMNSLPTWTRDPAQLTLLCNVHPDCVAVSTDGWLYTKAGPLAASVGVTAYVKSS